MESCNNSVTGEITSNFVVPEIKKKVHEIEQTESYVEEYYDLEFFIETTNLYHNFCHFVDCLVLAI